MTSKGPNDPEYIQLLNVLERYGVGKGRGFADRQIVADVFFAVTDPPGIVPRFATADKHVIYGLARIAGIDPKAEKIDRHTKKDGKEGFPVTVNGLTIRVLPQNDGPA